MEPRVAQEFSVKSLSRVLSRFPILKSLVEPQKLDTEWKQHALLKFSDYGIDCSKPAFEYWSLVFKIKNVMGEPVFTNLKKVFNLLFILPFSNASVERVFSVLNDCKTNERNKLKTETVKSLIATREGIRDSSGILEFEPSKEMLNASTWEYPTKYILTLSNICILSHSFNRLFIVTIKL